MVVAGGMTRANGPRVRKRLQTVRRPMVSREAKAKTRKRWKVGLVKRRPRRRRGSEPAWKLLMDVLELAAGGAARRVWRRRL